MQSEISQQTRCESARSPSRTSAGDVSRLLSSLELPTRQRPVSYPKDNTAAAELSDDDQFVSQLATQAANPLANPTIGAGPKDSFIAKSEPVALS